MKLRILTSSYVSAVEAVPVNLPFKTEQLCWKLHISNILGCTEVTASQEDIRKIYTDGTKSRLEFVANSHRDISRLVFPNKLVVTKFRPSTNKKFQPRRPVDLATVVVALSRQEVLVSYYLNGNYQEEILQRREILDFLHHRSILYHSS